MLNDLLVIGPRYSEKNGVGGVVILFEMFLSELDNLNKRHCCIDSNVHNYSSVVSGLVLIYFRLLSRILKHKNISIHAQNKDFIAFVPFLVVLKKIFRKRISMRKFAGNFIEYYESRNFAYRWLIRFSLNNIDTCFFETKYLVEYFKKLNPNTYWFPNVRRKPEASLKNETGFNRKFVFIGHIKKEKGIFDLVEAFATLQGEQRLTIYGPIESDEFESAIKNVSSITYGGSLKPDEVLTNMVKANVLVLPSYKEGYPGVIIEAFSVGIPVIATSLTGIQEIVTNGESGILFEPGNIAEISEAITLIDGENWQLFSDNALRAFDQFDSQIVTRDF